MSCHLDEFTIMNTYSIDEMHNLLVNVFKAHSFDAPGDQSLFHARAAFFDFGETDLSFYFYNTPVSVELRNDDFFHIQVCVSGTGRTSNGHSTVDVDPTVIVCSTANTAFEFGQSYEQFMLRADRPALERELTALLGSRPKGQICLRPLHQLRRGPDKAFARKDNLHRFVDRHFARTDSAATLAGNGTDHPARGYLWNTEQFYRPTYGDPKDRSALAGTPG